MPIDDTRTRIMLAAEQEFALKGIDGARVSAIVEIAGSGNAAAINYYFRSKKKLLSACLNYRAAALDHFQEKLYNMLVAESQTGELELLQYYFLLIAPNIAAIKHSLPNAYYSRFKANYRIYADANPQAEKPAETPIAAICVRNAIREMNSIVGEEKTKILTQLHGNHLAQGVARLEAYIMHQQISDNLSIANSLNLLDELTLELIQHTAFLTLKEQALNLPPLDSTLSAFKKLCETQLPLELELES